MTNTLMKKLGGTIAIAAVAAGGLLVTVPGASAQMSNQVQQLMQGGNKNKPNCVNGEHVDRGNNKNNGNGGCGYGYGGGGHHGRGHDKNNDGIDDHGKNHGGHAI